MGKTPPESLAGGAAPGSAHRQGEREVHLMDEVVALRQQVADLQAEVAAHERTEEALRDSAARKQLEARFRLADSILSAVQNLVLVANDRGEVIFASPSVSRLLGYAPEEVLGEGWLNLTRRDSEERARIKRYLSAAAKGEVEISPTPYEREMYDKQGNRRWILWQDARGPGNSLIGIGSDITGRKQAEEALRASEERHRSIITAALDAVITIDSVGLITGWNRQAETIFGWSQQEAIGQPLVTTIIPFRYYAAHERGLKRFLATGEGVMVNRRIEIMALHRDGHEFLVELTVSPI